MSITGLKKPGIIALSFILPIFATLLMTANICRPYWKSIPWVTPPLDGKTLTATFIMDEPDDRRFCWRVTDTEVQESPSQVTIGIQISNPCAPLLSWGTIDMLDTGYMHKEDLHLNSPLNGRAVIEKESGQKVAVSQPDGD
ncbi:hypothetical protein ACQP25_25350 [Microtetraspora malaysiensis]|uniref:hypothetical protein n=1 Tax=Microtetraspora malaysiensis TaxID=161358 RepID=UPI003D89D86D